MRQLEKNMIFRRAVIPDLTTMGGTTLITGVGAACALPSLVYDDPLSALSLAATIGTLSSATGVGGYTTGVVASHFLDKAFPTHNSQSYKMRLIGGAIGGFLAGAAAITTPAFESIDNFNIKMSEISMEVPTP